MKENIAGKNIKVAQVFIVFVNIISAIILLINVSFFIAILVDIVPLMILYLYIKLYSISTEGDYLLLKISFLRKK